MKQNVASHFYKQFTALRTTLAHSIKNNLEETKKFHIAQRIFNRIFLLYFITNKHVIRWKNNQTMDAIEFFEVLLSDGDFVKHLYQIFDFLQTPGNEKFYQIGEYMIKIPYLHNKLLLKIEEEKRIQTDLKTSDWQKFFSFLNTFEWVAEDEASHNSLTPEILGYIYERSVVEWDEQKIKDLSNNVSYRKKAGVFYTRDEITQYIIKYTLYPTLFEKLDNRYENSIDFLENGKKDYKVALEIIDSLIILDPACGSGAFLIKAAEELFKIKCTLLKKMGKSFKKTDLKKRIIHQTIYGVDLLEGAIEITKLRLLLWVIASYTKSNEIAPLPNIEHILEGNSLIGEVKGEFFDRKDKSSKKRILDEDFVKLKPFHWATNFKEIHFSGGFDIIIGNPPYGAKLTEKEHQIISEMYSCTTSKNTAEYFLERSYHLLKDNGFMGFVVPKQIAFTSKWRDIREYLLENSKVKNLFDVGLAFEGVDYEGLVVITNKCNNKALIENNKVQIDIASNIRSTGSSKEPQFLGYNTQQIMRLHNILIFKHISPLEGEILQTIKNNSEPFGLFFNEKSFRGIYFNKIEEKQLQKGKHLYIRGGPSIQRHYLKNIKYIRYPEKRSGEVEKLLKPKVIFKALRGTQLVAYVDAFGRIISDSNMNNIILKDKYSSILKSLQLILNHKLASFYISKLVFSETTETARHLDTPYVAPIPIPKKIDFDVCNKVADTLLFLNQYYFTNFLSKNNSNVEIERTIKYFEELANAIIYELFFRELLTTKLQKLLDTIIFIDLEKWTKFEYSNNPSASDLNEKDIILKITEHYKALLDNEDIESNIITVLSHEYVKWIEDKKYR